MAVSGAGSQHLPRPRLRRHLHGPPRHPRERHRDRRRASTEGRAAIPQRHALLLYGPYRHVNEDGPRESDSTAPAPGT
jgi:hypothetical protein